jgi:hypothetical protein
VTAGEDAHNPRILPPQAAHPEFATAPAELELAQVVYEARAASAVVFTYDPDRYIDHRINVVDLRS